MTCAKIPFPGKREAKAAAAQLSRRKFGGWRRGQFVTVYPCGECSGERAVWHMTRSKPRRRAA